MPRRSLARWLVVVALAAFGLGFSANLAFAQDAAIEGQNSADDGVATTGTASGANSSDFGAGATASASGDASAQQMGTNSATVNQSGTGQSGDPVAGGQVTGAVGNATVQNQNNADGNIAVGGGVVLANAADLDLGPSATSVLGAAQASQLGSNSAVVDQVVSAETGDAVAGSQITGIANADEALVQNQNAADDNVATSGAAVAVNLLTLGEGPTALSLIGDTAQASQVGDNDAVIRQASDASSGDGVAGSQVTGVVGGSDFTVQNQNSSEGNIGVSGPATAVNTGSAILGPAAASLAALGGTAEAQAGQTGDNTLAADQVSAAVSGDALAGAQVTGLVSSEEGQIEVQNQQASEDDLAVSGAATSVSSLSSQLGPTAAAISGAIIDASDLVLIDDPNGVIDIDIVAAGGDVEAQASQIGDNAADVAQAADSTSGDAVAGGQVTGVVTADGSEVTIEEQNSADLALASTGASTASVTSSIDAGPEALAVSGLIVTADTPILACIPGICDAVDGAGNATINLLLFITAVVVGGDADAQASQTGDNAVAVDQTVAADSGDAVAGAQVTGVVSGDDSDVTIQNQNNSDLGLASSGAATATAVGTIDEGPRADAVSGLSLTANSPLVVGIGACAVDGCVASVTTTLVFTAVVLGGAAEAQASQVGDNAADVAQAVSGASGDAVAGSQVTGAVVGDGSELTIEEQNASDLSLATSGDVTLLADVDVDAGPDADATTGADIEATDGVVFAVAVCVGAGCVADTLSTTVFTVVALGGAAEAQASQTGDNTIATAQAVSGASGDAVSGAQVTGAVAGDDSEITIQNQNNSDLDLASSGDVDAEVFSVLDAGTRADAESGLFADLSGNDTAGLTFCVGAGCAAIADAVTVFTVVAVGGASDAQASQIGDNAADVAQAIEASSGDAVAGSQVTGAVAGDDSEITISEQNAADLSLATSGDVDVFNDADVIAGQFADAFSGAEVDVNFTNTLAGTLCVGTGCAAISNASTIIGVFAVGGDATGQASQTGDNTVDIAQAISADSGDAVSGAQVTGAVAGDDSEITISEQNTSDLALASGGDVAASNGAFVVSGPEAETFSGLSLDASFGTTLAGAGCIGDGCAAVADSFFLIGVGGVAGAADSQASQIGDNTTATDQAVAAATGDAVAGAQVTGAVAGSDSAITVENQNNADLPLASSGSAFVSNTTEVESGPLAETFSSVDVSADFNLAVAGAACVGAPCAAIATSDLVIDLDGVAGDATSQATQTGDNDTAVAQSVDAATGDAVAGSQVTGAVAGDDSEVTISEQNTSDLAFATSGAVVASNDVFVDNGPEAVSFSAVEVFAFFNVSIADADCVGAGCAAVAIASLTVDTVTVGGDAESQASQNGDNSADVAQALSASSGDAVGGSQVTGVVAPDGEVLVEKQNNSDLSISTSGTVVATNDADVFLGPEAVADLDDIRGIDVEVVADATCTGAGCAEVEVIVLTDLDDDTPGTTTTQAEQIGDNDAAVDQALDATTGDAVSGSQVTGIVGAEDSETLVQNTDDFSVASSGVIVGLNSIDGALGPVSLSPFGEAQAQIDGDSTAVADQVFGIETGDALTGSQVNGVVGA